MTTMRPSSMLLPALLAAGALCGQARATTVTVDIAGPDVSADLTLGYGTATDSTYPGAYEVTNISGSFSDTSIGIVDATVGPLVPIDHATPEAGNLLAPNDFSRFAVASGLAADGGFLTYDNLYWPGGSLPTATSYPVGGGFLDIYGLLFGIGNGMVVDFWSNGATGGAAPDYGIAVATSAASLDYVGGGVAPVPEPSAAWLLGGGLLAIVALRKRTVAR